MKRCQSCSIELPTTAASNTVYCDGCRKERKTAYHKKWRARSKEHERAYAKAYRQATKKQARQYANQRYAAHRNEFAAKQRVRHRSRIEQLKGVSRAAQVAAMTDADKQRFWSKVDTSGDCWVWTKQSNASGYGLFYLGGRTIIAHRVAYQLTNGPIADGLFVCHRCDNPPCCNPDHLFPGDQLMNMQDMASKKRHWQYRQPDLQLRGEQVATAKLTEGQVRQIRALARAGIPQRKIAEQIGINQRTVGRIIHRKAWAHVIDQEAEDGQGDVGTAESDRGDRDRSRHAA